jgi:Mg-chelatase subunit ChlD
VKKDYTHLTVILDRSGSMESIRSDVIGGFNAFLAGQKETEGQATLSLIQFDTGNPYEVLHTFKPIADVAGLSEATYVPRGGTPLIDAIGYGIKELEEQIIALKAEDRPEHVVMVIITDGMENSSRHFTLERVRALIAEKQELVGWKFLYLSADIGAVEQAIGDFGIRRERAMAYDKTAAGSRNAFASVNANINSMRRRESDDLLFGEEDRERQLSERRRKNR